MFKNTVRFLLGYLLTAVGVLGLLTGEGMALAKIQIPYNSQGRRDPFVQPQAGQQRHVMTQVDIAMLKLTGIIRDTQTTTALFTAQTGPHFGYLLKGGRLFSENHQPVAGISGEVVSTNEVVLQQNNRQIHFQLHAQ